MDTIKALVTQMKEFRDLTDVAQKEVDRIQAEIEKLPIWQELQRQKEALKAYQEYRDKYRQDFLDAAMQQFDGENKHPVKGMQVKEFKTITVTDPKAAMTWASQFCPSAIKLDEKKLGSAVADLDVEFVEKKVEYRPNLVEKELTEYE